MAIPTGGLTVANLDAGTDRPDLARTEILAAVQKINEMLAKLPLYADGEQNGTGTQRVGLLKVGPEAAVPWDSATRAVDIGSGSSIFQTSAGSTGIAKNLYTDDDGVSWKYRAVGTAQLIWLGGTGGETSVYNAPSAGGAGTVATITRRLDVSPAGAVTFGANTALHSGNIDNNIILSGRTGQGESALGAGGQITVQTASVYLVAGQTVRIKRARYGLNTAGSGLRLRVIVGSGVIWTSSGSVGDDAPGLALRKATVTGNHYIEVLIYNVSGAPESMFTNHGWSVRLEIE